MYSRSIAKLAMRHSSSATGSRILPLLLWGLAPIGLLFAWQLVYGADDAGANLLSVAGFVWTVLLLATWTQPHLADGRRWEWSWPRLLLAGLFIVAWGFYRAIGSNLAAWMLLAVLAVFSIHTEALLEYGWCRSVRWGIRVLTSVVFAALVVTMIEFEVQFSDEEFFSVLEMLVLTPFWWSLYTVWLRYWRNPQVPLNYAPVFTLTRRSVVILLLLGMGVSILVSIHAYQRSFYPVEAPQYAGITADRPYLCGTLESPGPQTVDGQSVHREIMARVEANPQKEAPEFGMLALGTQDRGWAQAFRVSVLKEAKESRFTEPAYSVKSIQYLAALRLYYVERIQQEFPNLFSADEMTSLHDWFAAVNARAMTVEWVDWMYGLAFSMLPEGPYENQETGTGLLSLLESTEFADPDLSVANRDYLDRSQRGWQRRFRNIDDAYVYQPEWITNAYFHTFYAPNVDKHREELAFEWLLLQTLPDGSTPQYNHPIHPSVAATAYMGANLLGDPRYMWLADHALMALKQESGYLYARPGAEYSLALQGAPPTESSCLMYGDSGLPNQVGPLAPDKIVFRDGWSQDDAYLLLNLRFTGWHRYKATNSVSIVYQGQKVIADALEVAPSWWLPEGRSLVRDKQIPRETLSGLVIQNSGLSDALQRLTGLGSRWAQDPPAYATVVDFRTNEQRGDMTVDWSHTQVQGWRRWQHDRWIHFYHDGPIVVVDRATGPKALDAAITWQLAASQPSIQSSARYTISQGATMTELVVVSLRPESAGEENALCESGEHDSSVRCVGSPGQLDIATVILPDGWVGAEVRVDHSTGSPTITVSRGIMKLELAPHI